MSSGGEPIKRSDEFAGRTKMRAQRAASAKHANLQEAREKVADERERQQVTTTTQSPSAAPPPQVSKLVFGLNPRAHRAQVKTAAGTPQSEPTTPDQTSAEISITSNYTNSLGAASKANQSRQVGNGGPATVRRSGQIRASKYGNFYKPQDLTRETKDHQQQQSSGSSSEQVVAAPQAKLTMTKSSSSAAGGDKANQPAAGKPSTDRQSVREQQPATTSKATGDGRPRRRRSTSRSPDRSKQMTRRKSFDEDISTIKTESVPSSQSKQQQQQQQPPVLKTRTQFNILPPPQLAIATTGKGSVVGYAKSRIYDRPVKQILANPPESTYSALDDRSGQIPASILSGFKPPKQVNVSKAREKWEGGEPFAKCKSRKRLAAQANKKLFPGTWSMTSVVATQQLHLQQALAQSANSANHRSNPLETDPSVKVLTRGSVLERVQQFEKAPISSSEGSALNSSPGEDLDSLAGETPDSLLDVSSQTSGGLSRSSSTNSLGSDGGQAVQQHLLNETSGTSWKQAHYKSKVSSIQQQQQQRTATELSNAAPVTRSSSTSSNAPAQQRRISLRRRSSTGPSRSSTESLIPKFYHPNGKPNTYEIEIRKRDIVACFDKLPERRAQASANPNATSRKQFHQIATACGYSEYFKVPLELFVAHKLETEPKLAQMSAANHQARQRKSSTVALDLNGSSTPRVPLIRSLTKANSVDSNSNDGREMEKKEISFVNCEQFLVCWRDLISQAYDNAAQFIHLLTFGQRNHLTPNDFVPLVQSIIDDHPGLKFLRAAPDFHMRYIQTVIARIFFNVNRSWTSKITLQELRKSNLLAVLTVLGQEEDINQITDYFSYEHFYVIYCKFWNLDQDHDLFISKEDLARHNDAAISSRIIERIFSGVVSKQIQQTGRMSYSDFVWFLIAEEDKKHPRSIEYWFRLMDLDGDGYISMYEMEYFYFEQTKRLELMNIEALPFLDSACQILDLVNPKEKNKISLADLKRTKMATIFFDTFINLEKYLEHESREFVSSRDIVQGGVVISDWDRYASEEYENLVIEESTV